VRETLRRGDLRVWKRESKCWGSCTVDDKWRSSNAIAYQSKTRSSEKRYGDVFDGKEGEQWQTEGDREVWRWNGQKICWIAGSKRKWHKGVESNRWSGKRKDILEIEGRRRKKTSRNGICWESS